MKLLETSWGILLISLCIGLLVTASGIGMDHFIHEHRPLYTSDIFEGVTAVVLSFIALNGSYRRRCELVVRIQAIEDVNHHVRNALTAITYSAALRDDPALCRVIEDANMRVDWVLREVLPQYARSSDTANNKPSWSEGAKL